MNVPGSLAEIEALLAATMPRGKLAEELQGLFALVFRPEQTVAEEARVVATYVADLQGYPAEVLLTVFRQWRQQRTRRPTIAELRILADRAVKPVYERRAELQRQAAARLLSLSQPEISPEERERRRAVVEELVRGVVARSRGNVTEGPIERVPHWSEGLPADHPRMVELREAREKNRKLRGW